MKIINEKDLNEETFVDNYVSYKNLDLKNKTCCIELNGGSLNSGEFLSKARIVIEGWEKLEVTEREDDNNIKVLSKYPEFLKKIYEFHYKNNELKLVDLGYGYWVDWIFSKPKVTVYGEFEEN